MKYLWKLSTHYVDRDIRDTKVRSVSREQKLWRVGTHDRNEREKIENDSQWNKKEKDILRNLETERLCLLPNFATRNLKYSYPWQF